MIPNEPYRLIHFDFPTRRNSTTASLGIRQLPKSYELARQMRHPRRRRTGLNVRVAKVHGEHVWHVHDNTGEFFLVIEGELHIALREEQGERTVVLPRGAVFTVPRGIEHKPSSPVPT